MPTSSPDSRRFEFYFSDLDTLVQVEESDGAVVVRATRDNVSERRKHRFIHELAAEGFIPDSCRWFSLSSSESFCGVRWVVDTSWVKLSEVVTIRVRRFVLRLFLSATLLLLAIMAALILHR
jgi:hypothetical protein